MQQLPVKGTIFRFGPFELEPGQQELRRRGLRLRASASRLNLLLLFVTRRGNLVTREEIAECLWHHETTVDFTAGINTAVNQLRAQLGDDPAAPKYIETVKGSGYRFISNVVEVNPPQITAPEIPVSQIPVSQISVSQIEAATTPASLSATELQPAAWIEKRKSAVVSAPSVPQSGKRRVAIIAIAAAILLAVPALYLWMNSSFARRPMSAQDLELVRLTSTGDIQSADISADGKYLAFVRDNGGQQSLWVKQLATDRAIQLITLGHDECPGLVFSPDGNYLFYVRIGPLSPTGDIYRVPLLGGDPVQVIAGVSGAPAMSPDGRKVAFVRSTRLTRGEDSIILAALDGTGERKLATYKAPGIHFDRVAWTTDGKRLIFPLGGSLMTIAADGGEAHPVPGAPWGEIDNLWALPGSNDILVVGAVSGPSNFQIFRVSLDTGEIHRITHDLSRYVAVRATQDGNSLIAVQDQVLSTIQIQTVNETDSSRSLGGSGQNRDGVAGLAWTPEGKILYSSQFDRQVNLMQVDANGANARQLAHGDGRFSFSNPTAAPHGDFIAFTSWSDGDISNIGRMDLGGGNRMRLTSGRQDFSPSVSPDGKWVIYGALDGNTPELMKVSSSGGRAMKLTDYEADDPVVSPDGRWVACYQGSGQKESPTLAIVPFSGGPPGKRFQLPETASPPPLAWTPDGSSVAFINNIEGVGNIFEQPIVGGPATAVTHFKSGRVFNFQWSRDGRLALARGTEAVDVVLIRKFREDRNADHP